MIFTNKKCRTKRVFYNWGFKQIGEKLRKFNKNLLSNTVFVNSVNTQHLMMILYLCTFSKHL